MYYVFLIIILSIIFYFISKRTFHWEIIIKHLWKIVYNKSEEMADYVNQNKNISDKEKEDIINLYKKDIEIYGNVINSILNLINHLKKEEDTETDEEETFGYGRFDFEKIKNIAKNNPDLLKNVNKK